MVVVDGSIKRALEARKQQCVGMLSVAFDRQVAL